MTAVLPAPLADGLAAVLRGEPVSWRSLGVEPADLLAVCAEEDLTGLVHHQLGNLPEIGWPQSLRDSLTREARAGATRELLRRRELVTVLDALAARDIHPILLKGTPLAYTVYEAPSLRPRSDTDLLISLEQSDTVRRVMTGIGYSATNYCDGEFLFCQFELGKEDAFGVGHAFDFHWKISTQS
ncbi:MAG: nucleotidyltransferase family protein, partial [Gemmatimonadales bacterium]|nr:nucleotidyltransferase family protein [Gemmatimonadales bacterium]